MTHRVVGLLVALVLLLAVTAVAIAESGSSSTTVRPMVARCQVPPGTPKPNPLTPASILALCSLPGVQPVATP
jgi:hypothetical protein